MTATSGPGLSLMTEMMGLSSMAEIPAVIVDCQRAGPATGMPSRTEQSDLWHAVFAGHGDFPRVVLGVFDVVHAHEVTNKAFRIAEAYQLPVLVLSDAYIAQRTEMHDPVPPARAGAAAGGRGTRATRRSASRSSTSSTASGAFRVPGTAGRHVPGGRHRAHARGQPHRRRRDAPPHEHQALRASSTPSPRRRATGCALLGPPEATRGIVAWGSQYGMLREWLPRHPEYRAFLPEILHPFPLERVRGVARRVSSRLAVVELSFQGQFHRYLSGLTDLRGARRHRALAAAMPLTWADLSRLLGEERP